MSEEKREPKVEIEARLGERGETVGRRWRRVGKARPPMLKLRNGLNIAFMLLAVSTIALYFACPLPDGAPYVFTTGVVAVIVKTVEVVIRLVYRKK